METVCVLGAGGYVGSQLVRTLLQRGFTVHATLRNPEDSQKTQPLLSLEGASERLKLFKGDLNQENSFDSAIQGCHGVFHVASPVGLPDFPEDKTEEAAAKGVVNVLRSCSRAATVKRVVFTSSIVAAAPINQNGEIIYGQLDESTWTPLEFVKNHKRLYYIYKLVAEQTAFRYGEQFGIQVVSICPAIVGGPFLTQDVPLTPLLLLSPLTGNREFFGVPKLQRKILGSVSMVHIDDVCNAHVFLMQQTSASGRYICSAVSTSISEYFGFLRSRYPHLPLKIEITPEDDDYPFAEASSKKLREMGFVFKHRLDDIGDDSISSCQKHGFVP